MDRGERKSALKHVAEPSWAELVWHTGQKEKLIFWLKFGSFSLGGVGMSSKRAPGNIDKSSLPVQKANTQSFSFFVLFLCLPGGAISIHCCESVWVCVCVCADKCVPTESNKLLTNLKCSSNSCFFRASSPPPGLFGEWFSGKLTTSEWERFAHKLWGRKCCSQIDGKKIFKTVYDNSLTT